MHYRACNSTGLRFDSNDHTVQFGPSMSYAIPVSPRTPDLYGAETAFSSGEDPGSPAYGMWRIPTPGDQPVKLAGVTWRSLWPGRYDPDGWYYLSGNNTRETYYKWKGGVLQGPISTGTTSIEGIAYFQRSGDAWSPVWQNRAKPITVDGYILPLYTWAGGWLYGIQKGSDRSIARDPQNRWWLVTTKTSQVFPCVKEQADGSLLVAWNGDACSFLSSNDGWQRLPDQNDEPEEVPPPGPPTRCIWRGMDGWRADGSMEWQPGNFIWGQEPDGRPALEGMPWAADLTGPMLVVLIGTEKDTSGYPTKQAQMVACLKEARKRKCAVAVYCDDVIWTPRAETLAQDVLANNLPVVRMIQAYLPAGESAPEGAARVSRELAKVGAVGMAGVMMRADPVNHDPAAFVGFTAAVNELIERSRKVVLQAVFGTRRPNANPQVIEQFHSVIARMRKDTPPALVVVAPAPAPPSPAFIQRARSLWSHAS